jgi:hypothetical protein
VSGPASRSIALVQPRDAAAARTRVLAGRNVMTSLVRTLAAPLLVAALSSTSSIALGAGVPAAPAAAQVHTWYDGDDAHQAYIDGTHVAVVEAPTTTRPAAPPAGTVATATPRVKLVKLGSTDRARLAKGLPVRAVRGATMPVFTEARGAGRKMTLPGNVMVWLDLTFDEARCADWLRAQGLEPLGPIAGSKNGFVVAAPAGLPSLTLANALRTRPGARAASPVWWKEVSLR